MKHEMHIARTICVLLLGALSMPGIMFAQTTPAQQANTRCQTALVAMRQRGTTCVDLAVSLVDTLTGRMKTVESAPLRTFQSARAGGATAAGTPGQTEAVPGLQPTALAAASIASAGTDSGSKSIAAISLNPATLFGGNNAKFAAAWSRFGDITVLIPTSARSDPTKGIPYFGVRTRLNISGVKRGNQLLLDVEDTFKQILGLSADMVPKMEKVLDALDTQAKVDACVRAIQTSKIGTAPADCGGSFRLEFPAELFVELRERTTRARDVADAQYAGLDLRFDSGDPTLSNTPALNATSVAFGLGFGRRNLAPNSSQTMSAIRLYVGGRYTDPRRTKDPVLWSGDGGIALELSRLVQNDQYVQFSAGLEARASSGSEAERDAVQPSFLKLHSGVTIPIAGGASVAVGFSTPFIGKVSPSLTVNFNWGLLLGALAGAEAR